MYKVFFNDRIFVLTDAHEHSPELKDAHFFQYSKPKQLGQLIEKFINNSCDLKNIIINHTNLEELWTDFQSHFTKIVAAGGLVINEDGKYLFIFRRGKWDLPKGKADDGETPEMTALREVSEETGLNNLKIIKKLPDTYHCYFLKNKIVLKQTHWFEMSHTGNESPVPQTTEDITEVTWLNKSDIPKVEGNTFPSVTEIIIEILA